jgi:hypothetical protein
MKARFGPDDAETLVVTVDLAIMFLDAKDPGKAIPLVNDVLAAKRRQGKPKDPRLTAGLLDIAFALHRHKQYSTAETVMRECVALGSEFAPDSWTSFYCRSRLGASLLGQKKYKDAGPLLKEGYEGMKQREKAMGEDKMSLIEALEWLVQFYEAADNPARNAAEAERWRKELAGRKAAEKEPKK